MATRGNLFRRLRTAFRSGLRRVARGPARDEPSQRDGLAIAYDVPLEPRQFSCALYQSLGVTLVPGHQIDLLDNGSVFDALVTEISSATVSINLVIYIWEPGSLSERIVSALAERARAGVPCRLLVDTLGSPRFERDLAPALVAAGCEVRMFRPRLVQAGLRRNHRKLLVVDGRVGFTGGFGLRDTWLGDGCGEGCWRDVALGFTGPAVAAAQQAFAENWQEAGGALLPETDFPAATATGPCLAAFVASSASTVTRAERVTQLVIAAATRRLWISNAYFAPPRAIMAQLIRKAQAGVDVRLLLPGELSDSRPALAAQRLLYSELLRGGVRVWEYQPSTLHSKAMVVDDLLVTVGSINLDPLSLDQLEEGVLIVHDATLAVRMARGHVVDCSRAKEQRLVSPAV